MANAIEVEPKCDDYFADNIHYSLPRPTLRAAFHTWRDKRRIRHAMKVVKRLFKGNVPHIEDAHTLELIEGNDGCIYLRIMGVDNG